MRALLLVEPISKPKSMIRKEVVQLGENFRQPNVLVQLSGEPTAMLIGTSRSRHAYPGFNESVDVGKFNPLQIGHWFARFEHPRFYFTTGHRVPGYVGWVRIPGKDGDTSLVAAASSLVLTGCIDPTLPALVATM